MDSESKFGLGLIALLALCCAGPLVLSLVASGAILGAISAIWATDRRLLLSGGGMLIALGAGTSRRRNTPGTTAGEPCDCVPMTRPAIVRRCGRRCSGAASPGC